jgi:hypothetical protein
MENPEFLMADRTRCLASFTEAAGIPTISRQGNPPDTSVSTMTRNPSTPDTVALNTEDSKPITSGGSLVAWRFWSQAQRR